jgi:2-oxoglutarate dehydrogenase E2 component (dihydrolipoamide succinyltransferase)
MPLIEMKLPQMGESVTEATVITWLVKEGEPVREEEPLLEVATDKVDTEVHASHGGILQKILVKEGQVAQIGKPIALIHTGGEDSPAGPLTVEDEIGQGSPVTSTDLSGLGESLAERKAGNGMPHPAPLGHPAPVEPIQSPAGRFYSPLVRSIAQRESVSVDELEKIPGSGLDGRLTADDLMRYLAERHSTGTSSAAKPAGEEHAESKLEPGDEVIEMDRVRKIIAGRMKDSLGMAAHVHSFLEADVTGIIGWKNRMAAHYLDRYSVRLTYSPVFIEAIARALVDFPMLNSSVDGTRVVMRKHINIGMAVALPNGNLIVPVIKDANTLDLAELARRVNDLAQRARENKLSLDEISGATYTMTNVGQFGTTYNTPIIMQPNVGILAFGTIEKKPVVLETEEHGDIIAIRQRMVLSHAYDHRVIDGALGSMFVKRVKEYLENFDTTRQR